MALNSRHLTEAFETAAKGSHVRCRSRSRYASTRLEITCDLNTLEFNVILRRFAMQFVFIILQSPFKGSQFSTQRQLVTYLF
jgi:hypothetical protein